MKHVNSKSEPVVKIYQVGNKESESKFVTYWRTVFTKCVEKTGKYCQFPQCEYLRKVPIGCVETPNTGIIVAFSGFREKKDELFVLSL